MNAPRIGLRDIYVVGGDGVPLDLSPLAGAVVALVCGLDLGYPAIAFETPEGHAPIDARAVARALHNVADALADQHPVYLGPVGPDGDA